MSVFGVFRVRIPRIYTEYGDLRSKCPYSTRMRENTDQKNCEYGHISRSVIWQNFGKKWSFSLIISSGNSAGNWKRHFLCSECFKTRSSHWRYSIKKVFLKTSQISQENTCTRVSFLIKLQADTWLWHGCFSVNFAKFEKTPFFYRTPLGNCIYIIKNEDLHTI